MKKLLYILVLLLGSCAKEMTDDNTQDDKNNVRVNFSVDIPEAKLAVSKAIDENAIYTLNVLVFDENARFISRHQATMSGNNYVVTLPRSTSRRTLHFVANYDWSSFNNAASVNKSEGEIVAPMQSTGLVFWQRVVLTNGISANILSGQPVSMIRNMAKFSLVNNATSGLTNARFALFNSASSGSIAPFNTTTRAFESIVTEPAGVTFTTSTAFDVANIYTYERKNSTVTTNPTFVIVQGTYAGTTNYYKIDIIDASKNVYDIQRNVWYRIVIESVNMAGYTTVEAAKSSPASNNISASVLLQSYPTISDGSYVLSVDKTVVSFTSNGQTLRANATYKTVGGVSFNSSLVITLIQNAAAPLVNGAVTYDAVTGNLTAAIHDVPTGGAARTATIKIEAGYLSRTIRLMLHSPFIFTNVNITPSVVSDLWGSPATLKFTVPVEAEYLLPFNCYISSAYLTPDFGNIEVIYEGGVYKYKRKVTAVGEQTINFKTNVINATETVLIDANLFQRGQVGYANTNGSYRFSNVVLTPNPVNFGIGNAVSLRFTVPSSGAYQIYTNNLTPVTGSVVAGVYTHIALTSGEQTVQFTTNKQNSAETIRLTRVNYTDYPVNLKNQLVRLSGTLTYGNTNAVINSGVVTVLSGVNVAGVFKTAANGAYNISLEVKIGDILTFQCTIGNRTYVVTTTVTSANMPINLRLI